MPISRAGAVLPDLRQALAPVPSFQKDRAACRILLADQDRDELNDLYEYLGDIYHLFTATSERKALRIIESQEIHLLISGLELTDAYGTQLCAHLKSSVHFSHIPVILLIDGRSSRIKSLQSGADACIERPLTEEYLKAQAGNLLANRARLKDYFVRSFSDHVQGDAGPDENETFLHKLNEIIFAHLHNKELNVDRLARLMNMSRPTFYRKVKCVSDLTPNELVNVARLNRAAELISTTSYKVFEVVKMVGFNSQSNFGKAFFRQFHATPTEYQRRVKGEG
ncbi:helix-turn-helix domain-containing protein [Flavitalea sp. BT771]|uniref:helix-turn-helix domain-containing protein n=1 Tax=Flavitalea sp. BT771 TaxID=3063329 RepID=UPI0026E3CDE4|nr:helix-turn-helix domain-containing protein [Flavitalea sp. BT771]MDO6430335.1 helix-turn-helix domain-containing protein [Flavitalea sp. BT771]MDV6219525.1 helix-turn-helix domain-containing protein [Flavitalea sp. BT771]